MRERTALEHELGHLELETKTPSPAKKRPGPSLPPACAQPSPWPDADCDRSRPSADVTGRRVALLRDEIRAGITNKAHFPTPKGPGLFAGSWDWHSAVHAHWALLSIARVHKDKDLETFLAARITDKALRAERDFLNKDKTFELPYGRAWLLMVLFELERRGRRSAEIVALRKEMQQSVLAWMEALKPDPSGGDPRFNAGHGSWLFAYMLVGLSEPQEQDVRDRLRVMRRTMLEPVRARIAKTPDTSNDFTYLPAILAVIDRTDPISPAKPAAYPVGVSPPLVDPPFSAATAHTAGAAVVRVWPHAIDSHLGDKKACSRFHARMNEMFSRTDHWADSFEHVAHWVPQFMWMALWLGEGRP
jgi:hypothetical protein